MKAWATVTELSPGHTLREPGACGHSRHQQRCWKSNEKEEDFCGEGVRDEEKKLQCQATTKNRQLKRQVMAPTNTKGLWESKMI